MAGKTFVGKRDDGREALRKRDYRVENIRVGRGRGG